MTRKLALATAIALCSAQPANSADPALDVFGGFSVQPYSVYAYLGGVAAMNGNLTVDGFLTRLNIGVGGYSYQTTPGVRQAVSQQAADAMLGYQFYLNRARISAYAGLEMQNHDNADLAAVIRGARLGGKGQIEAYSPIGEKFFSVGLASLSSNYRSYYTKAKIGYRITDWMSFGPEGMAQGN
ncbi:unnamed protein product, partial [Phaeothamnion confervicola]